MDTHARKKRKLLCCFSQCKMWKMPQIPWKSPKYFFSSHLREFGKNGKICPQKPFWAWWLRMVGKHGAHFVVFQDEHRKWHEYFEEVPNSLFSLVTCEKVKKCKNMPSNRKALLSTLRKHITDFHWMLAAKLSGRLFSYLLRNTWSYYRPFFSHYRTFECGHV